MSETRPKSLPFYFEKFLSSLDVKAMTTREVGVYTLLLFNSAAQENPGYLNTDEEGLMNIAKETPAEWEKDRKRVLKKFKHCDKGYFNNALLIAIKQEQERIEREMDSNRVSNAPENPNFTPEKGSKVHPLQQYVNDNFHFIKKIHFQLTYEQCEILRNKFHKDLINEKLILMEDTFNIHQKANYVFLKLKEWCQKELKK